MRSSGFQSAQANSIEGDYRRRSKEELEDDEAPPSPLPAPDYTDAWNVEVAVRILPLKQHVLLKLRYVLRWRDETILRMWRRLMFGERLTSPILDEMSASAAVNLRAALELPQVVRKSRAQRIARKILSGA